MGKMTKDLHNVVWCDRKEWVTWRARILVGGERIASYFPSHLTSIFTNNKKFPMIDGAKLVFYFVLYVETLHKCC